MKFVRVCSSVLNVVQMAWRRVAFPRDLMHRLASNTMRALFTTIQRCRGENKVRFSTLAREERKLRLARLTLVVASRLRLSSQLPPEVIRMVCSFLNAPEEVCQRVRVPDPDATQSRAYMQSHGLRAPIDESVAAACRSGGTSPRDPRGRTLDSLALRCLEAEYERELELHQALAARLAAVRATCATVEELTERRLGY